MKEKQLNKWYDELIWCPSQCYYYFMHDDDMYCIYLRWRHQDPWNAEIIKCAEADFSLDYQTSIWKSIKIPFFKDSELDKLKEFIMIRLDRIMALWSHSEQEISLPSKDREFFALCYKQQCEDPELNKKFRAFHVKAVNEIISFCKENGITVDELYLHADGLSESIKAGEWVPATDSQFELRKFTKAYLDGELNEDESDQIFLFSA